MPVTAKQVERALVEYQAMTEQLISTVEALTTQRDAALAKVEGLEKALKLVQSHALTAWQRGNQAGISSNARSVREAVDAMNKARQVTLDENAIFTDLLERAEGRGDQLAALLARCQEKLDCHRDAVLWVDVCAALFTPCAAAPNIAPTSEHKVPEGIVSITRSLGRAIVQFNTSEQLNEFYRAAKSALPTERSGQIRSTPR